MRSNNGRSSGAGGQNGAVATSHGETQDTQVGCAEPLWKKRCRRRIRTSVDVGNLMADLLTDMANGDVSQGTVKSLTKQCEIAIRNAITEEHLGQQAGDAMGSKILVYARDGEGEIPASARMNRILELRRELAALGGD